MFPVSPDILKCKKLSSCMIKHTVYHNFDSKFMSLFYESYKIIIIPQTTVHHFIISGVVTVGGGFE